jgi:hypothetical protein
MKSPHLRVLLGIDKACQLLGNSSGLPDALTFFCISLRIAKENIFKGCGFFSLLVDTTSCLSNINPPAHLDPKPQAWQACHLTQTLSAHI